MNKFFKYFLPWFFNKLGVKLAGAHQFFKDTWKEDQVIGLLLSIGLMGAVSVIGLCLAGLYSAIFATSHNSNLPVIVLIWSCVISGVYSLVVGIQAAYDVFVDEQNDLLNKLKE